MSTRSQRRVFILPDGVDDSYTILRLRHPRTSTTCLCALNSSNKLFEIVHYDEPFSSWLIDDSVIEDGSLHFLTPVDPLFFILPYANLSGKFCRLQDILTDDEFPETHRLEQCCSLKELCHIFDYKESSGFQVFCFSQLKALHWLQAKVKFLSTALKNKNINITDGSTASTLSINRKEVKPEIWESHACHLVSEYISEELSLHLFESFGLQMQPIKPKENTTDEQSKRSNTEVSPTEDYSKKYKITGSQEKKIKLTAAQKRLEKVDKTGMKSISSFFTKK